MLCVFKNREAPNFAAGNVSFLGYGWCHAAVTLIFNCLFLQFSMIYMESSLGKLFS